MSEWDSSKMLLSQGKNQNVRFPWLPPKQRLGLQSRAYKSNRCWFHLKAWRWRCSFHQTRLAGEAGLYNTKIFPWSLTWQQNRGLLSPKQANTVIVINMTVPVVVVVIIIKLERCNWPLFIFHGNITCKNEGIGYFFRHIGMASSMIHYKPFDQAKSKHMHKVLNEVISTLFLVVTIKKYSWNWC